MITILCALLVVSVHRCAATGSDRTLPVWISSFLRQHIYGGPGDTGGNLVKVLPAANSSQVRSISAVGTSTMDPTTKFYLEKNSSKKAYVIRYREGKTDYYLSVENAGKLLLRMAGVFDVFDHEVSCLLCTRDLSNEEKKVRLLQCCMSGVHESCLREMFPDDNLITCPKCRRRTRVTADVLRRDEFSPTDADKIEQCFLKHQAVNRIPMTKKEIEALRVALNVRGFRAMRHVSHRVFAVGLAFWFHLPKEKFCDWEDIVARLSLGLIWNMVSEMRDRYQLRVQRDGRGDAFHHFLNYLLEVCGEDDEVPSRDAVVQTCAHSGGACAECTAFASVFEQRSSDRVALGNRSHLYQRVEKGQYNSFVQVMKTKK